jgi:hypothetical protein
MIYKPILRLFIPVGTDSQYIMVYDKQKDGTLKQEKWMGVMVSEIRIRLATVFFIYTKGTFLFHFLVCPSDRCGLSEIKHL